MIAWANRAWVTVNLHRTLVSSQAPSSSCSTLCLPQCVWLRPGFPASPTGSRCLWLYTVIHRFQLAVSSNGLFCSSVPSSACVFRHRPSIALCNGGWTVLGFIMFRPLLCVPGGQRPSGRQNPRVPCLHLAGKPYLEPAAWTVPPRSGVVGSVTSSEKRQQAHSPGLSERPSLADLKRGMDSRGSFHGAAPTLASCSSSMQVTNRSPHLGLLSLHRWQVLLAGQRYIRHNDATMTRWYIYI